MADRAPTARVRPPAIPDDLGRLERRITRGRVRLPTSVRWSGPEVSYDLADRDDRRRVYEQVLREGTVDDVVRYVELDELIALWSDLYLPDNVRREWAARLADHRGVRLPC